MLYVRYTELELFKGRNAELAAKKSSIRYVSSFRMPFERHQTDLACQANAWFYGPQARRAVKKEGEQTKILQKKMLSEEMIGYGTLYMLHDST